MKKAAAIILALLSVLLCACKATEEREISAPVPKSVLSESSDNSVGARFTFTLTEFNDRLNEALTAVDPNNDDARLDRDNWQLLSHGLVDDTGIDYSSYYYVSDTLTYVAAVENESGKVFNLGCGCPYDIIADTDSEYYRSVVLMTSLMAIAAGGYHFDAIDEMNRRVESVIQGEALEDTQGIALTMETHDNTALMMITAAV